VNCVLGVYEREGERKRKGGERKRKGGRQRERASEREIVCEWYVVDREGGNKEGTQRIEPRG